MEIYEMTHILNCALYKKGVLLLYRLRCHSLELSNYTTQITSEREMIEVPIVIGSIASCKGIQDSPGFLDSMVWIPNRPFAR